MYNSYNLLFYGNLLEKPCKLTIACIQTGRRAREKSLFRTKSGSEGLPPFLLQSGERAFEEWKGVKTASNTVYGRWKEEE